MNEHIANYNNRADLIAFLSKKSSYTHHPKKIKHIQTHCSDVNTKVVIGPRWRTINTFAREYETDLIIMGPHGIRNLEGEISVGTTSHKVMFPSPCPLLIVRYE